MSFVAGLDLCDGAENLPVLIEGDASSEGERPVAAAAAFQYTPENVPGPGCTRHPSELTLPGCDCRSASCQRGSCSCLRAHGQAYGSDGCLREHGTERGGYSRPVFECNALCACGEGCSNRVVQRGLGFRLSVFPARGKGWGLRALEPVPRGSFVCEYAGEVLGYEEACRRQRAQGPGDMNYIVAVREHAGPDRVSETFVDPAVTGNVGRFLNHSCQPNLSMVPVRVHSLVPRLALFALRDIAAGEELTFDYSGSRGSAATVGPKPSSDPVAESSGGAGALKRKPCRCGAQNCSLFLPLDLSVIKMS